MNRRYSGSCLAEVNAQRICVIKPSAFGDIVQVLPLLPVLRARFPNAELTWLVKRELAALVEGHPCLDHVLAIDFGMPWYRWGKVFTDFRRRKFDVVIDLQGLARSALFTASSGAALKVGMETGREGSLLAYNYVVENTGRHLPAHRRYRNVAEALGVGLAAWKTELVTSEEEQNWAQKQVEKLNGPVVALHAGARWVTKLWPTEKFKELARRVMREYAGSIVLVGGGDDRELGEDLESDLSQVQGSGSVLNLIGKSNLKQLTALMREVDILLSNDSGPMHLAAGVGTPVLGVFTSTSPVISGPAGSEHELFTPSDLDCVGCYHKNCPLKGEEYLACHRQDDVDQVWEAVKKLVSRIRSASKYAS